MVLQKDKVKPGNEQLAVLEADCVQAWKEREAVVAQLVSQIKGLYK